MDKTDRILAAVLKKVTPDQRAQQAITAITQRVQEAAQEVSAPHGFRYTLAGSFLRDTWMPHKKEFDLFILLPEDLDRQTLEEKGLEIGRRIVQKLGGAYKVAYAEHPYVRAQIQGYSIDIVPCYHVASAAQIKSAVDRTPFHNRWLAEHFRKEQAGQARLLKQFTTGLGIYGSDAQTEGFSGYLSELLIVHYGSFRRLVTEAARWEPGMHIDLMKHKDPGVRFADPLIVIDPVDPKRNVAAVLSPANFMRLVSACRQFVQKPSLTFFFPTTRRPRIGTLRQTMKKRGTRLIAVQFRRPDVLPDIWYPQLRKTAKRLEHILAEYDFRAMNSGVWSSGAQAVILFEMEVWSLPRTRKLRGPEIFARKRARQFLTKYRSGRTWVEGDCWVAEISRKYQAADAKLRDTLSETAAILRAKGIASLVAESVAKRFALLDEKRMLALAKKEADFAVFLDGFFSKTV